MMRAVARVREFNRTYTRVIGVLQAGMVGTPHSLTDARVLYELARGSVEVADLRARMDIDAGHLSRVLSRLDNDGLVERAQSPGDARRQVAWLTGAGERAYTELDRRQDAAVAQLLTPLPPERRGKLVEAMATIQDMLGEPERPRGYVLRAPEPGDLGWVVSRHGALYAQEYGWDAAFEALVARIVADYTDNHEPARDAAWIAEADGTPVGSVFCVHGDDPATAHLRMLLVERSARGLGIGARLVEECLRFARRSGYSRMTLWTNDVLVDARRVYQRAGFELKSEVPHRAFGHDLAGQVWAREL